MAHYNQTFEDRCTLADSIAATQKHNGPVPIGVVHSTPISGSGTTFSGTIPAPAMGNFLVLLVSHTEGAVTYSNTKRLSSVSCTGTSSWAALEQLAAGAYLTNAVVSEIWWGKVSSQSAGTSISFTFTGATSSAVVLVLELSGLSFTYSQPEGGTSVAGTTASASTITYAAGDIVLAVATGGNIGPWVSFPPITVQTQVAASTLSYVFMYQVFPTAGSITSPAISWTVAGGCGMALVHLGAAMVNQWTTGFSTEVALVNAQQDTVGKATSRFLTDAMTPTDFVSKTTSRTLAESPDIATAFADNVLYSVQISQQLSFSDLFIWADALVKTPSKTLLDSDIANDMADGESACHVQVPVLTDTFSLSDRVGPSHAQFSVYLDQFSLSDSVQKALNRPLADALALADSILCNHGYVAAPLTDAFMLADVLRKVHGPIKTLNDYQPPSDSIARVIGKPLADQFTLSDAAIVARAYFQCLGDVLSLSDSVGASHARFFTCTDLLALADSLSRSAVYNQTLTDTIPFSDSSVVARSYFETSLDTFLLVDTMFTEHARFQTWLEVLPFTDSMETTWQVALLFFNDLFTLTDSLFAQKRREGNFSDALSFSDAMSFALARVFFECFSFVEFFAKAHYLIALGNLNGYSLALTRIAAKLFGASRGISLADARVSTKQAITGGAVGTGLAGAFAHGPVPAAAAATGVAGPYAIEGAGLLVGSFDAAGSATVDAQPIKILTGIAEAEGAAEEEMSAPCHFAFAGFASAAGRVSGSVNYLLRLRVATKGGSTGLAQVYSPVFAEGALAGASRLGYISRVMTTGDRVYGQSTLSGNANALVHTTGLATAMQASYAEGTANYGPGRIAGTARGSGLTRGIPHIVLHNLEMP